MSCEIIALPLFIGQLKKLKKKYPKIKEDYANLLDALEEDPESGNPVPGYSNNLYKIRLASRDQNRGKRGGFRVVYYFRNHDNTLYLVTIYAKSYQDNFDRDLIKNAMKREGLL